jgi:hypothetical protein
MSNAAQEEMALHLAGVVAETPVQTGNYILAQGPLTCQDCGCVGMIGNPLLDMRHGGEMCLRCASKQTS